MGLTPPSFWTMFKKTALFSRDGFPNHLHIKNTIHWASSLTIFSGVYVVMHWMQLLSWLTHVRQRRSYAQISSDTSLCLPILIIMIADTFVLTVHHLSPHGHNHPKWLNGKWWLSYKSSFPTLCSQLLPACLTPESHGTFEMTSTGLKYFILNTYLIFAT